MMEDEIKSTAAGEENQAEALVPSSPSESAVAPAPTPSADVNAAVPAPAPAVTSAPAAPVATTPAPASAAANPAAAQQGAPASFCRNCGQALTSGDAFCPKCGTPRGIAAATPQPVAASVNAAVAQPAKTKKKKTLAIAVAVLALVAIVIGVVVVNANNAKPKGPDFQALYDEYCSSPWAKVANDGSYLAIDTNPSDRKADSNIYILEADQAIKDINKALGFDESLHERMGRTNALAGMQSETGNGVRVSWDYNTNDGLEVTYSLDNE